MSRRCSKTGKVKFLTSLEAKIDIARLEKNLKRHRRQREDNDEMRSAQGVYKCEHCRQWHLTSGPGMRVRENESRSN